MESTWVIYKRIFTIVDFSMVFAVLKSNPTIFLLLVLGYASTLLKGKWKTKLYTYFGRQDLAIKFIVLILVIQLMIQMRSSVVQPFIYFQF